MKVVGEKVEDRISTTIGEARNMTGGSSLVEKVKGGRIMQFRVRDLLAVPFWYLAQVFEMLALRIGGAWTAVLFLETYSRIVEDLRRKNENRG